MNKVIVGLLLLMTLAACGTNPMGATTRQSLRSAADVERARLETYAQVETARAYAEAQEHSATQETIRTGIVMAVLPWLAVIIVAGCVVGVVVWWQGKIWHTKAELQGRALLPESPSWDMLPQPRRKPEHQQLRELCLLAQRDGYSVEVVDSVAYLIDDQGNRVGRRLLTGG